MAIKITKEPMKCFSALCPKCGCEFTYEFEDVTEYGVNSYYVQCPSCHADRNHFVSYIGDFKYEETGLR